MSMSTQYSQVDSPGTLGRATLGRVESVGAVHCPTHVLCFWQAAQLTPLALEVAFREREESHNMPVK